VILLFVAIGNGIYVQEHLNRIWDRAAGEPPPTGGQLPPPP
jgi:hypothetical protein